MRRSSSCVRKTLSSSPSPGRRLATQLSCALSFGISKSSCARRQPQLTSYWRVSIPPPLDPSQLRTLSPPRKLLPEHARPCLLRVLQKYLRVTPFQSVFHLPQPADVGFGVRPSDRLLLRSRH